MPSDTHAVLTCHELVATVSAAKIELKFGDSETCTTYCEALGTALQFSVGWKTVTSAPLAGTVRVVLVVTWSSTVNVRLEVCVTEPPVAVTVMG